MHDGANPRPKTVNKLLETGNHAHANLGFQQLLGSENASRERGNIRICHNHLGGKLNVEDRPDSMCNPLSLTLGPEAEVVIIIVSVSACTYSG